MNIPFKTTAIVFYSVLSAFLFASTALADAMFGTGGYNREMHTMEMMKMIDANGDHMVSTEEFNNYYSSLFDALDANHDGVIDAKEWVGTKGNNTISIATGGYSRELRTMPMMKAMDTDGDHKVTKDEFIKFHETIFKQMDTKGQGMVDAQSWLRKLTGN